ncbi:MAG: hypothetical protein HY435_02065 [Candidatus Liptonbacteria bacterium]|nr:hypothetical protein [Candidatus Liptonbacteria bacterium]
MHIVRVGTAITFLWVGVLIFRNPEEWGGLLQPWAAGILPVPMYEAMIGTAILDVAIGFFLLVDLATFFFSLLAFLHLALVLTVVGIDTITVRDIGLFAASLGLMLARWPERWTRRK